jgi:hypothetical protein
MATNHASPTCCEWHDEEIFGELDRLISCGLGDIPRVGGELLAAQTRNKHVNNGRLGAAKRWGRARGGHHGESKSRAASASVR